MVATIIFGGGLSGLAAAYELGQLQLGSVQLVEKDSELGGMERTYVHEGVRFDPGSQTLALSPDDPTYGFLRQLIGEDFEHVPVTTAYCLPGTAEAIPDIKSAFKHLTLRQRSLVWRFHGMQRLKDCLFESELMTARDAWIAQFGKGAYDLIVGPYYRKLWGENGCAGIVADRLINPLQVRRYFNPIVDAFEFDALSPNAAQTAIASKYTNMGVGQIAKRLVAETDRSFVELLTKATVEKVEWSEDRIRSVTVQQSGGFRRLSGDHFISSIPITELVKMLVPTPPSSVRDAADALQFRARVLVTLFLKNPKVNRREWVYAVDPALPYLRYGETSQADTADAVMPVTFEYSCNKDDHIWNARDVDLAHRSWIPNQTRFQTRREADLVGFKVHRFCHALPVHRLDYEDNLLHVRQFLRTIRNLHLAGASSNFVVGSIPYSLDSGLNAARNLPQAGLPQGTPMYAHS